MAEKLRCKVCGLTDQRMKQRFLCLACHVKKQADRRCRKVYGITLEQRNQMEQDQEGLCYICRIPHPKTLHVDHDHSTGKARRLLCESCNIRVRFVENGSQPRRFDRAPYESYLKEFAS